MEELSLNLIFKSFSIQNSKLRIHSKPDRNLSKVTVCSVAKMTSSFDCCARLQKKKSFSLQAFQALSLKIAVTFERDAQKNMT